MTAGSIDLPENAKSRTPLSQTEPATAAVMSTNFKALLRGVFICRTSKMSHDGSWRAACLTRNWILILHLEAPSIARGVTAPGVGSGALLGDFCFASKAARACAFSSSDGGRSITLPSLPTSNANITNGSGVAASWRLPQAKNVLSDDHMTHQGAFNRVKTCSTRSETTSVTNTRSRILILGPTSVRAIPEIATYCPDGDATLS